MDVVAVDVQRPVVGIRLELNVAPVLIIDARVHSQAAIEHSGFLAKLVAQDTIRLVRGGPLAARITLLPESPSPGSAGGRIGGVASTGTETGRHGRIRHQVRADRAGL